MSTDGEHILLIQVAALVAQVMSDDSVLDAIQPMRAGWCIYMRSITDRAKLVAQGITVASRYIQLQSDVRHDRQRSVKVTLHDLPLHSVDNADVLDTLREVCHVTSPVQYANVWHNDQLTSIRNGDRFVYMEVGDIGKLPNTLQVGEYVSRILKPVQMATCKRCNNVGHQASDKTCPALASEDVRDTIETFHGGAC